MTNTKIDNSQIANEFRNIFQNSLKVNARSMSVKTLLSERNLKRIDYQPYYQRNYVWDTTKQSFFIESVILGTEIPPLILFKSGVSTEVIDGRQRFQTLKRFKENDLSLNVNGLKELQALSKKSFNKLTEEVQEIFLNSHIRVFEFEVVNHPNLDDQIIDRVKKEIFRRYNTGITPLNREELDNAKYDDDQFSELFKTELKSNQSFLTEFNKCFFPNQKFDLQNIDGIIAENVVFIRKYRILNQFPISTYAAGKNRTEVSDLLYEFVKESCVDPESDFLSFKSIVKKVLEIREDLNSKSQLSNYLIYECILWALTILDQEGIEFSYESTKFSEHYLNNISLYADEESFFYRNIINRYKDTGSFFQKMTGIDFSIFIRDEEFKHRISELKQTDADAAKSIEELSTLRQYKPNPVSIPVDEIRKDLSTTKYLLRPSYQRQEVINDIKASSIIESILLGINLPPIFIYNNKNGVKEVVDGQQRLLAIIGFLGEQYTNENGKLTYSKKSSFKLKGLKILTDLEGRNYSNLPVYMQDRILDFVIDLIFIEENANFDPVDLFIRLNSKPYPIKSNSFEMWNSIVNYEIIKKIKEQVTPKYINWFFLRERSEGKPDRMENEELITILSYKCYNNSLEKPENVIGFYQKQDRITGRLKNKESLGDFLMDLDNRATDKLKFLDSIDQTDKLISLFAELFDGSPTKEKLNEFLNVKRNPNFRRSLQDFYVIWEVIDNIPEDKFLSNRKEILADITEINSLVKNVSDCVVDKIYYENFNIKLEKINKKYSMSS